MKKSKRGGLNSDMKTSNRKVAPMTEEKLKWKWIYSGAKTYALGITNQY
jgi:hypothetical protein